MTAASATSATSAAYGTYMLTKREIARYLNVWGQTVVPPVVSAALFLFVFGHALGGRIGDFGGVPYLTFLVPGLVVMGAIQSAYSNTSSSLFDARRAGYIEDVLTSPLTNAQVALAYTLSGATRGILVGGLTLLVALPAADGWSVNGWLFGVVLVLSCLVFSMIGILVGLVANRWDHIFVPVTFILTPLVFLGGVFYPASELAGSLQTASRFNPILYLVDAQRASLIGFHEEPILRSVLLLVALLLGLWVWVRVALARSTRLRG
ncbi:MAG: ABC transporter permease [Thermoplasmatota archaeon]